MGAHFANFRSKTLYYEDLISNAAGAAAFCRRKTAIAPQIISGIAWDMAAFPKLRVARASDDLDALVSFYRDGVGLDVISRFEDHEGFDGVMLGREGVPYHFEFTRAHGHSAGRAPTQDSLLVFYLPDAGEWEAAVARMKAAGYSPVPSFNPYWDRNGITFEDPDGYRVVFEKSTWRL